MTIITVFLAALGVGVALAVVGTVYRLLEEHRVKRRQGRGLSSTSRGAQR